MKRELSEEELLDRLELQLDYLNKKCENFMWYIFNGDFWELDKKLSNCVCWGSCNSIKNSYFDEDDNDRLIIEFMDDDDEKIVLDTLQGGYM